ncbi:hypothetical protein [Sandaracinus amylolyticus]|nr:hypothetical protein [Sandaracinus amylolyticus]
MALKRLSTENMATLGADLIRRGSPERIAIEAVPAAAALLPDIEAANRGLIESQPITNAAVAKLTAQLHADDVVHDELVHAMFGRLESERRFAQADDERAKYTQLRDRLFPTGVAVVNLSWTEQGGEAKLRAGRVTESDERLLAKLKIHDGTTLLDRYRALQQVATTIDANEKSRAAMVAETITGSSTVRARNQWIRVVNALAMVLAATGTDEAPILGRVRALEARAEGRAAPSEPEAPGVEPIEPVTPAPVEPSAD